MNAPTPVGSPRTVTGMAGKIDKGRIARLELRMTPEERELIEQAAVLGGEDASGFVRRVALIEARTTLAKMKK